MPLEPVQPAGVAPVVFLPSKRTSRCPHRWPVAFPADPHPPGVYVGARPSLSTIPPHVYAGALPFPLNHLRPTSTPAPRGTDIMVDGDASFESPKRADRAAHHAGTGAGGGAARQHTLRRCARGGRVRARLAHRLHRWLSGA